MSRTQTPPTAPPNPQLHRIKRLLAQAGDALGARQFDKADALLFRVLATDPQCIEGYRLSGISLQMRGHHKEAVEQLRIALELEPDNAAVLIVLGTALYETGDVEGALATLRRACERMPDAPAAWFNLGRVLKLQRQPEAALDALDRALALDATHLPARQVLADVQVSVGQVEEAASNYRQILKHQPGRAKAWVSLANLKSGAFTARDVSTLRRLLADAHVPPHAQAMLGFALANALEQQGHYADAYAALERANALERKRLPWDADAFHARIEDIAAAFPKPLQGATDASLGEEVIFITCLPRSGSSLTEQILASHSQVEGAGELTALQEVIKEESDRRGRPFPKWVPDASSADWERLGTEYLARTERWRQGSPRFTDKNVLNWMYVGAAMAMLPGARIVNTRRYPLENAFGCFRQLFVDGSYFSYALDDIAAYWRDYDRLSRHWQGLFSDRFFDHELEALVAAPETWTRRIVEFCGLDVEPACLSPNQTPRAVFTASAAQVRQPIGAPSQGTYAYRYGPLLDDLRQRLANA